MDLTRIAYNGRKIYRDKFSGNTWEPGAVKLVTPGAAKNLLRFAEFARADAGDSQPSDAELENAIAIQKDADRTKEQERQVLEAMLLTVQSMDKSALEEYARKYEVELDKRLGVGKLRAEVSTLIEQFGAR
jgi:hypothetical protein